MQTPRDRAIEAFINARPSYAHYKYFHLGPITVRIETYLISIYADKQAKRISVFYKHKKLLSF